MVLKVVDQQRQRQLVQPVEHVAELSICGTVGREMRPYVPRSVEMRVLPCLRARPFFSRWPSSPGCSIGFLLASV
jgi:hypothetical protein